MAEDDFRGWKLGDDGNIIVNPVVGWATATAATMALMMKLDYITSMEEFGTPRSIQFVLTPAQALELSETLKKGANAILGSKPPHERPS